MGMLAALQFLVTGCGGESEARPNLLLISVDRMPRDSLDCSGEALRQRYSICELAQEARLYRRAFSPTSFPGAAAASLLTGRTPEQHGVGPSAASFLRSAHRTLAERLQRAGYSTVGELRSWSVPA